MVQFKILLTLSQYPIEKKCKNDTFKMLIILIAQFIHHFSSEMEDFQDVLDFILRSERQIV